MEVRKNLDKMMKNKYPTLASVVSEFRILKDWNIRWGRGRYRAQCFFNPKTKTAIIYPWGSISKEPVDYRLHEVLHIVMAALNGKRLRSTNRKNLEEDLVQDLCRVYKEKL